MSKPFRFTQILRCPLCIGGIPAHVGNSVMRCQNCGNTYRVVMATRGNTGRNLVKQLADKTEWAKGPRKD